MLLVSTFIEKSPIHGIGLFSKEFISKDTIIWSFNPKLDIVISRKEMAELGVYARETFLRYCYQPDQETYVLCFDDARFINHSDDPNTTDDSKKEGYVIAAKDINSGEEITSNYKVFDLDFQRKLGLNA